MDTVFKYAVSAFVLSAALKLAIFYGGYNFQKPDDYYLYAVFMILLLGIFLGMRKRIMETGAKISLKALIKDGCKVAAIFAVLMAGFLLVYYKFIDPGYFNTMIHDKMALLAESGASVEETMQFYLNAKYLFFVPRNVATIALFGYLVLGCVYAVMSGILLRRNLVPGFVA